MLAKVSYEKLNSKQKERYNFQKVSAVLADYGYATIKLDDDWQNADFIAQHIDGSFLKVQLKARFTLAGKYVGKGLWICFRNQNQWYLYEHDAVLKKVIGKIENTDSWKHEGLYSWGILSKEHQQLLEKFAL